MEYAPKHTTGEGCQVWVTNPAQRPIKNRPKKSQRPYPNIKTQFMHYGKSLNCEQVTSGPILQKL